MVRRFQTGGVLIMMLVILGMIMVMLISMVLFIDRQFRETSGQEQEERSFHLAEAGVHYTVFLLNGGGKSVADLLAGGQITKSLGPGSKNFGTYSLSFSSLGGSGTSGIQVTSEGRDTALNRCQQIVAQLERGYGGYEVRSWDHRPCI